MNSFNTLLLNHLNSYIYQNVENALTSEAIRCRAELTGCLYPDGTKCVLYEGEIGCFYNYQFFDTQAFNEKVCPSCNRIGFTQNITSQQI